MTDHLLVSKENGVATLTMNRPEVRNALSIEMRHAMFEAVDDIEHDASVRCVVLKGAGGHFMAGGDIKAFTQFTEMSPIERQKTFEARIHNVSPSKPRTGMSAPRSTTTSTGTASPISWVSRVSGTTRGFKTSRRA